MAKEQYISIAEFAERAGVNRSYIYKLLSTKLSTYCLQVDNQKKLNIKALELFNAEQVDNLVDKKETDGDTLRDLIEILQEQQKVLKKELDIKNEQIRDLSQSNHQQLQLIDQQQKLQAISEAKRLEMKPEKEETSLLNRAKFSTETEYSQYLCRLLPRIGLFSSKQDKAELEKVLELMSEEERELIYKKKDYREAIEHIRKVDFDKREQDFKEIEKELDEMRKKSEELRQEIIKEQEERKAKAEQMGGV